MKKIIYILATTVFLSCSEGSPNSVRLDELLPVKHVYIDRLVDVIITDKCVIILRDSITPNGIEVKSCIYKEFTTCSKKDSIK